VNLGVAYGRKDEHMKAAECFLNALILNPLATHIWIYLRSVISKTEDKTLADRVERKDLNLFRKDFELVDPKNLPLSFENRLPKVYKLNNGQLFPSTGLGTAHILNKESIVNAIMKVGYVHIDTAKIYKTEEYIGEALKECFNRGKKREDIWVTTKLWHNDYHNVEGALKSSLEKLQLDYVNVYLIHFPMMYYGKKSLHQLWGEMEALVDKGLTKSIGVSNFNAQIIWDLLSYCKIKPVVN